MRYFKAKVKFNWPYSYVIIQLKICFRKSKDIRMINENSEISVKPILNDNWYDTSPFLPITDLTKLAKVSKASYSLFKPIMEERKKQEFLQHVARSEYKNIKQIIELYPELMLIQGKVTDEAGRTFADISGIEYTFWALANHTWTCMLDSIPKDYENKQELLKKVLALYNKVKTEGVTYILNGNKITEKHFDYENTIIKQLETTVNLINAPGVKNWDAINKQIIKGVGVAQKHLTAETAQEYSSEKTFYFGTNFRGQPEQKKQYRDCEEYETINWFDPRSKLGIDFAVGKGHSKLCHIIKLIPEEGNSVSVNKQDIFESDLQAMRELFNVRQQNFADVESDLKKRMKKRSRAPIEECGSETTCALM